MAPSSTPDRMSLTTLDTRDIIFDVEGYAAAKQLASDGGYFQSDGFSVGGRDWAVRYYPNTRGDFVSVTLVLLSRSEGAAGQPVGARFACAVQDLHGARSAERLQSASYVFSPSCGYERGFWKYEAHDVLEDVDFIVGDCLTLLCTVSVLKEPILPDWGRAS